MVSLTHRLRIQPLTEKAIAEVREIDKRSFPFGNRKSANDYRQCIAHPDQYGEVHVITDSDTTILGFVHFKPQSDESVLLRNMAVAPKHRRTGAGTFALDWLRRKATDDRRSKITLHVRASNCRAIAFYARAGYTKTDRQADGYRSGSTTRDRTKVTMTLGLTRGRAARTAL
jgi:ribosomal protein S18 acetylase RimI-like enzyme